MKKLPALEGRPVPRQSRRVLPPAFADNQDGPSREASLNSPSDSPAADEGTPNADASFPDKFDDQTYLKLNPDVAEAVVAGELPSAVWHWEHYGRKEKRATQLLPPESSRETAERERERASVPPAAIDDSISTLNAIAGGPDPTAEAEFDEQLYLVLNPDVVEAIRDKAVPSAYWHWQNIGRLELKEGSRPTVHQPRFYTVPADHTALPPSEEEIRDFDSAYYLTHNQDVAAALGHDPELALGHWVKHGRFEGRPSSALVETRPRNLSVALLDAKPFGVNFYAPFSAQSGLGSAARGYAEALRVAKIPVHLVNLNLSADGLKIASRDYDERPPYKVNLIQVNVDTMERFFRLFRNGWFDDAYSIAIWAWELNVLRPDWFHMFRQVDEVWTLSDYSTRAISVVSPVPVQTVNIVVKKKASQPADRKRLGLPDGFIFLTAFDVGSSLSRKNPIATIEAFIEAFGRRSDVSLVVKFHSSRQDTEGTRSILDRVRGRGNIIVRSAAVPELEMEALQASVDCLVSVHRSEGFGLNIAEFMAGGKPVIATGHSGNMDFTSPDNSFLIPFKLIPVERTSGPYIPGYLWAEPSHAALVETMQKVVAQPNLARQVGSRGAATIRDKLNAEAIGGQIRARLDCLGLVHDLPEFLRHLGRSASVPIPCSRTMQPVTDPEKLARQPRVSIVVPVYNVEPALLTECVNSVLRQSYVYWELCIVDDCSTRAETITEVSRLKGLDPRIRVEILKENRGIAGASNAAAQLATGNWLLMLDNDDRLAENALMEIAQAISRAPDIDVIYGDEDKLDPSGTRCDTYYKPDWSPEHIESVMYTLHPLIIRTSLFFELDGFREEFTGAQDWDLMLRASRATQKICHIPTILYHWRMIPGSASAEIHAKPNALLAGERALRDHVFTKYGNSAVVESAAIAGHYRVRHAIESNPPVTLLITTDAKGVELSNREPFIMIEHLVSTILSNTSYKNFEILVVDNGNSSAETLEFYKRHQVRLCSYPASVSPFNYSRKANFALNCVDSENLVVMNDDMEIVDGEWLSALLEFSTKTDVGGCGGKLLHDNGTIQHVGTALGIGGGAAHLYHGFPGDYVGYNGFTHVIRNYSALTGACLATRRSVLHEVGGWDTALAIDFNDIDLCLRMRQLGYRLVYTPYSVVKHFESKTAIRTGQDPDEVRLFRERWRGVVDNDPYYNPNLSRHRHDFGF